MSGSLRDGEIEILLRPRGRRALLIVEAGSRARAQELVDHLLEMACEVRPLVVGPVVACVVRIWGETDGPFDALAAYLRGRYPLAICEPGFAPSMLRVAAQLARDAEIELQPLECCDGCGTEEPFLTTLRAGRAEGEVLARFCPACLERMPQEPEALCRAMLARVAPPLPWRDAHLVATEACDGLLRYVLHAAEHAAALPVG